MPALLFSILIPILFGLSLLLFLWPLQRPVLYDLLLKGAIAIGLGYGLVSIFHFLRLLVLGPESLFFPFEAVFFLLALTALFFLGARKRHKTPSFETCSAPSVAGEGRLLLLAFGGLLALTIPIFLFSLAREPHGGWDAWAIWNLRARSIFRGGPSWKEAFSTCFVHADYPLLLPMILAFLWREAGCETLLIPQAIAMLFTFSTLFVLFSSVVLLRGRRQGALAGLALLGTPFYFQSGAQQLADHPLGFFFLVTLVLWVFQGRSAHSEGNPLLCLAGILAGLSAWTKNEGLLFLAAVTGARCLAAIPSRGWRVAGKELVLFLAGLFPIFLVILYFKLAIAPPNDIISLERLMKMGHQLIDLSRYTRAGKVFFTTGLGFTGGLMGVALLLVYRWLMGAGKEKEDLIGLTTLWITLALMLIGYLVVFVITPYDLNWHLGSSPRLFIQLWPGFLFSFFMTVRSPEEGRGQGKIDTGGKG